MDFCSTECTCGGNEGHALFEVENATVQTVVTTNHSVQKVSKQAENTAPMPLSSGIQTVFCTALGFHGQISGDSKAHFLCN